MKMPAASLALIGPHPSAEENRDLARRARDGDASARAALIVGNLALAVSMGHRAGARHGRDPEDAVGDAMVGLVRAGDSYDPGRASFSTHATWRIFGALTDGRRRSEGLPPRRRKAGAGRRVLWGSGLGGLVAVAVAPEVDADAADSAEQAARAVARLVAALDDREAEVIARRFGLGGREPETLAEVGRALDPPVTKERARQIELAAMRKLVAAAAAGPDARGGRDGDDEG